MADVAVASYTDINQFENDNYACKLFLGGLAPNTTEESLTNFYAQYGEVTNVVVKRDPTTQRSKGFGFVTYKDSASIERAQSVKPHVIDGRNVDSKPALPRSETNRNTNGGGGYNSNGGGSAVRKIFVGGLRDNHDEQNLQEYFQQFGTVQSVKILLDRTTGRKRGFGFVEFESNEAAENAVFHKDHVIDNVNVEVKKSNYRPEQSNRGPYQQNGSYGSYSQNKSYNNYAPAQSYNGWGGAHVAHYQQQPQAVNEGGYAAAVPAYGVATYEEPQQAGWNGAPAEGQFGSYHNSHGGGPQKGYNLQNNRRNPYNV
ncbi:ribonucleoprotein RB97D-like [Musca autumnalis]|uniref:ribonucleoprotein RB97D-like n=1 Tax=Musca autumnalis TaxID=221902 RepID=UPI003CF8A7CF